MTRAGFARWQSRERIQPHIYRSGSCKLVVPYRQPYILQAYVLRAIKALEGAENNDEQES